MIIICLFIAVKKKYFAHREFSFTLEGDIYSRFNSFADCEGFRKHVIAGCPLKMDFGAVYNAPVCSVVALCVVALVLLCAVLRVVKAFENT
jgi:hypothetical protein